MLPASPGALRFTRFHKNLMDLLSSNNTGRGRLFRGRRLFQILLTGSCALNILFYHPIKQKMITSNNLNMPWASKFGPLINLQYQYPRRQNLNRQWSNSQDQAPLQLDREVIKGEDGERGGDGWLFEEGDKSRDGYYSRIYGNLLICRLRWFPRSTVRSSQW